MSHRSLFFFRVLLGAVAMAPIATAPALAQLTVIDPVNLVQTTLNAARALEQVSNQVRQITNQVRQLENDARNLTRLGDTFAPAIMAKLRQIDRLMSEARGLALDVNQTRAALEALYSGNYRGTDMAARAQMAARQADQSRSALQRSLLLQAEVTEQLRNDQATLEALSQSSANAPGALAAQQATNEFLSFQAGQSMRLQALLVADSRAEALERAREMEVLAAARAQHEHFFSGAKTAHPGATPWN